MTCTYINIFNIIIRIQQHFSHAKSHSWSFHGTQNHTVSMLKCCNLIQSSHADTWQSNLIVSIQKRGNSIQKLACWNVAIWYQSHITIMHQDHTFKSWFHFSTSIIHIATCIQIRVSQWSKGKSISHYHRITTITYLKISLEP